MSKGGAGDRPFSASDIQLRRKFKHARAFGVDGPCNRANCAQFSSAMERHVADPETSAIPCTFGRGPEAGGFPALVYLNERTGLAVITDRRGRYVTGFRPTAGQLSSLFSVGRLGGGS